MRSRKSEEILKRLKALMPQPTAVIRTHVPRETGDLQPDLRQALDAVGVQNYAHSTARLFAKDGKYSGTRTKRRYALD